MGGGNAMMMMAIIAQQQAQQRAAEEAARQRAAELADAQAKAKGLESQYLGLKDKDTALDQLYQNYNNSVSELQGLDPGYSYKARSVDLTPWGLPTGYSAGNDINSVNAGISALQKSYDDYNNSYQSLYDAANNDYGNVTNTIKTIRARQAAEAAAAEAARKAEADRLAMLEQQRVWQAEQERQRQEWEAAQRAAQAAQTPTPTPPSQTEKEKSETAAAGGQVTATPGVQGSGDKIYAGISGAPVQAGQTNVNGQTTASANNTTPTPGAPNANAGLQSTKGFGGDAPPPSFQAAPQSGSGGYIGAEGQSTGQTKSGYVSEHQNGEPWGGPSNLASMFGNAVSGASNKMRSPAFNLFN